LGWGFEIGELLAAALRYRHLRFQQFCIKIIIKGIQKSEITDCDTGGCGMSDIGIKHNQLLGYLLRFTVNRPSILSQIHNFLLDRPLAISRAIAKRCCKQIV
jgi:hypothetical protein